MKGTIKKTEDVPQKLVVRIEHEHKIHKVKKIVFLSIPPKTHHAPIAPQVVVNSTFDEAKACCKARKRKERQESASSLCQERKVIRSNSEERPIRNKIAECNTTIRRVSSSGDFPKDNTKSSSLEKLGGSPLKHVPADKSPIYDDPEFEKRRSHERFARSHSQCKGKTRPTGKRLRVRYNAKTKDKDNGKRGCNFSEGTYPYTFLNPVESSTECDSPEKKNVIHLNEKDVQKAISPLNTPISPDLDFSILLEQVDTSEPLLSNANPFIEEDTETMPSLSIATNRSLLSPRNSIIATHKIYLDPDVPQANMEKMTKGPIDGRMHKLNKQINSQKKKIKSCEAEFEAQKGFKPSQIDKLNDTVIRKLYAELSKLKKEHKQLSDISASCSLMDFSGTLIQHGKPVSLKDTANEIEKKLSQKRESGNRAYNLEEMIPAQLAEEKLAMQKALLYLESVHGRPQSREDRDLVRPFYDRYRTLKRMVSKISSGGLSGNELATIHENETMNFVTPTSSSNDTESERTDSTTPIPIPKTPNLTSTDSDSESSCSENFHSLSREELNRQFKIVSEEKKELRRTIKEFEMNVQAKTGRMLSKEDKEPMKSVYLTYKQTKGKLRLLEALLAKN